MLSSRTSTLPSALFDVLHECALRPMTRFSTIYRAKPHLRSNRLRLHLASRNSSTSSRRITIPPPFPITPSCPEPTCPCAPTPQMPEGLEIDHERDLNGTMAPYSQQVLILTGQRDWRSRIEEDGADNGWGMLVRGLKGLIGRGGGYADPYNNIMITNTSFPPHHTTATATTTASALLFPSFQYIPTIPLDDPSLDAFVRAFLLPTTLHPAHDVLPAAQQAHMRRVPALQLSHFPDMARIQHSPTILICGHGHRDQRCGILGPLLQAEFRRVLQGRGFRVSGGEEDGDGGFADDVGRANVGLISHIGGHKYAGNVIIYLPPSLSAPGNGQGGPMSLAGKGIWYGRVEPRHVEGIVEETVLGGRVISEHFRGGVGADGEILRL
ncbi:prenyl protein peptidase [Blastomyces parvus]|uniref:Altered inheritance of mitochondria protein 32 n=1 Tax=Blastomyces parvus TaxID=2060905 RepID=A0A2B7XD81_9EURO|nr:prenyl protein peptidase [Blastomyces parvus]